MHSIKDDSQLAINGGDCVLGPWTAIAGVADCQVLVAECQVLVADCQVLVAVRFAKFKVLVAGYQVRFANCQVLVAGYRVRFASCQVLVGNDRILCGDTFLAQSEEC